MSMENKVYVTAAARMPSTAPLEVLARRTVRRIRTRRAEKRAREIREERNWRTRMVFCRVWFARMRR